MSKIDEQARRQKDLWAGEDANLDTIASFGSLKNHNNDISTKMSSANEAFYKSYQASNGPTPEPDSRKNYRTYPYDYFSGIDAKVFFGDVWVDDIVTIQYSVSQNKTPIYGYASQLYDAIARGTVIVQGTLTVSFKEMGYLNMVQRIIETQRAGAAKAIRKKVKELSEKAKGKKLEFIPLIQGSLDKTGNSIGLNEIGFSPNGTAQIIRRSETIEEILKSKKGGNIVSSGLSTIYFDEENSNGNRDFEDFAEILEDTVWGDSNGHPLGSKKLQFRRADEFDYNYANNTDAGGIRMAGKLKDGGSDYSQVLNIMLTFGDMNDFRAEHTLTVLNDVHFTSQSTVIAPTGEPIGETYTFFARDINQGISTKIYKIPEIKFEIGKYVNISKVQDVQKVEQYLNLENKVRRLDIGALSAFDTANGWRENYKQIITSTFNQNQDMPLIDQLIPEVERAINDTVYSSIDPKFYQYVIAVKLTYVLKDASKGSNSAVFHFVVQQSIANTKTYKVISPTRNNFAAVNIFNREDMWSAIGADELRKKKEARAAADLAKLQLKQKEKDRQKAQEDTDKKAKEDEAKANAAALAAAEAQKQVIATKPPDLTAGLTDKAMASIAEQNKNNSASGSDATAVYKITPSKSSVTKTQGSTGKYSHSGPEYADKAAIDFTPIESDDLFIHGKIFIPVSKNATLTIGKENSVYVDDQEANRQFWVAHVSTGTLGPGTKLQSSQLVWGESGGIYIDPIRIDKNSKKFSRPHGHFQKQLSSVDPVKRAEERQLFEKSLQEAYQKNNIKVILIR